jgi:hypothetical protein
MINIKLKLYDCKNTLPGKREPLLLVWGDCAFQQRDQWNARSMRPRITGLD